jgi:hypothetical protein
MIHSSFYFSPCAFQIYENTIQGNMSQYKCCLLTFSIVFVGAIFVLRMMSVSGVAEGTWRWPILCA